MTVFVEWVSFFVLAEVLRQLAVTLRLLAPREKIGAQGGDASPSHVDRPATVKVEVSPKQQTPPAR